MNANDLKSSEEEYDILQKDGYHHIIYKPDKSTIVIMTKKLQGYWKNILTYFSYFFTFFSLIILALYSPYLIWLYTTGGFSFHLSLKNRIQLTVFAILVALLIIIGGLTIINIQSEYNNYHESRLTRKSGEI